MAWERIIFATDLHGDMQDADAVHVFRRFVESWDPRRRATRIFGGDLMDLRPLRRGASAEERAEGMRADVDAGRQFTEWFRPRWWLRGNHDERLWDARFSTNGIVADYAHHGVSEVEAMAGRLRVQMLPWCKRKGVLEHAGWRWIHGFHHGVYAVAQHARIYDRCIHGHVHASDFISIPGYVRKEAHSVGSLCQLDMDYNKRHTGSLRHSNGWLYGVHNTKTGATHLWQAKKDNEQWVVPNDLVDARTGRRL